MVLPAMPSHDRPSPALLAMRRETVFPLQDELAMLVGLAWAEKVFHGCPVVPGVREGFIA